MRKIRLAALCSGKGRGSNFQALAHYFAGHSFIELSLVIASRTKCGAWEKAEKLQISREKISPLSQNFSQKLLDTLAKYQIDMVALAGFMSKIPESVLAAFPGKIVNIHPALLPKYGGKGMYGHYVHEQVWQNGDSESGATVHIVDEKYDHGKIIGQEKISLPKNASPEQIAQLVLQVEHRLYAPTIEAYIKKIYG